MLSAGGTNGQRAERQGGVHPARKPPNVQRNSDPGRAKNPGAGPGNLPAGSRKGAVQGRLWASPEEGSPKRARNPGAGPERAISPEAGLTRGDPRTSSLHSLDFPGNIYMR